MTHQSPDSSIHGHSPAHSHTLGIRSPERLIWPDARAFTHRDGCSERAAPSKTPNMDAGIPAGCAHIPDSWRRGARRSAVYKSSQARFLFVSLDLESKAPSSYFLQRERAQVRIGSALR
ncbi:uncharacterized [Tachysurus ichikawai]